MKFTSAVFILFLFTSAVSIADEVYSFQFQKAVAAPTPVKPLTPVQASSPSAVSEQDGAAERGWSVGAGFGDRVQTITYGLDNGLHLFCIYQFQKYLAADAQLIFGHASSYDGDIHLLGAAGLQVTPLHLKIFDLDLLDFSLLTGLMTAVSHHDYELTRIAVYIGYGVTLNVSRRISIVYMRKLEDDDAGLYQSTISAVYHF